MNLYNMLVYSFLFLLCLVVNGCLYGNRSVDLSHTARLGKEAAQIEVVVFSDFQCIYCKRAAAELKRIVRTRPNRVKVYFKHFPLSKHKEALNAAKAAEAARLQDKFWDMHDLLFMHSAELNDSMYEQLASQIGLDMARFRADMASIETQKCIDSDKQEGNALRVNGTPYFLINRRPFRGSYGYLAERLEGSGGF